MPSPAQTALVASRDLTDMTGALNEFQTKNLKMWPLLAIDGVDVGGTSTTVEIGESRSRPDDNGDMHRIPRDVRVVYNCTASFKGLAKKRANGAVWARWAAGADTLARWTRAMFWDSTEVEVFVNGKRVVPRGAGGKGQD